MLPIRAANWLIVPTRVGVNRIATVDGKWLRIVPTRVGVNRKPCIS